MALSASKPRKISASTVSGFAVLGETRLAELLAAAAKADPALMRSLSLELADHAGGLGEEIDRQLTRLRTAKGRLDARRATALAREVRGLIGAILKLGEGDPAEGVARLIDLLDLSEPVLERRSYEARVLVEAFIEGAGAAAGLTGRLAPGGLRDDLIERLYRLYREDEFEITEGLTAAIALALDADGRRHLQALATRDLEALKGSKRSNPLSLARLVQVACDVADAETDVDAYIVAQGRLGAKASDLKIASRLLNAGRGDEALKRLEVARPNADQTADALAALRIEALDAVGEREQAQAARWGLFQSSLSRDALKAYLKRLPDFEDVEREDEALDGVLALSRVEDALIFLTQWPDHRRAGELVRTRLQALDGKAYPVLTPAADAMATRDPLAASLIYRLMIVDTLRWKRSARNRCAARQLDECAGLAANIEDWEAWPSHQAFVSRLRDDYPRTVKFWNRVASL